MNEMIGLLLLLAFSTCTFGASIGGVSVTQNGLRKNWDNSKRERMWVRPPPRYDGEQVFTYTGRSQDVIPIVRATSVGESNPFAYVPIYDELQDLSDTDAFPTKRASESIPVSKRIHTCAFMSRLGLPIGVCFAGASYDRISVRRPNPPAPPKQNGYAYLEDYWPVHSMLGGGVGKR